MWHLFIFLLILGNFEVIGTPFYFGDQEIDYMLGENKQSVLIIDSDNAIVNNLTKRFKKRDMVVITAKDGYEGYVRACKEAPDIIILDALLSSMSGFRVSRLLKYDERFQHIKIVMITSNDLQAIDDTYKSCGADEILRKPFRFKELMDAINTKEEQLVW